MKPEIDQSDLSKMYRNGQTVILAYKRAYEIKYSHGASQYVLSQFYRHFGDLPLTLRGRYHAVTPDHAHKVIYQ